MDSRLEGIEDHLENIAKDTNAMAISLEALVGVVGSIRSYLPPPPHPDRLLRRIEDDGRSGA